MSPLEPEALGALYRKVSSELSLALVGQEEAIRATAVALFAGGHVLIEGPPGCGKTAFGRALLRVVDVPRTHVTLGPDVLASELRARLEEGASVFVADGFERASPRTQAVLVEAMDGTVSKEARTAPVAEPFFLLGIRTLRKNAAPPPVAEGWFDGFMASVSFEVQPSSLEEEIIRRGGDGFEKIRPVLDRDTLLAARAALANVQIDDAILHYVTSLVAATRTHPDIEAGASTRGTLDVVASARGEAILEGRTNVSIEDVRVSLVHCLRHRILLKPEVELDGISVEQVLSKIIETTRMPGAESTRPSKWRTSPFLSEPPSPILSQRPSFAPQGNEEVTLRPTLATQPPAPRPSVPVTLRPHVSPLARPVDPNSAKEDA